jgi:hypothetical protein
MPKGRCFIQCISGLFAGIAPGLILTADLLGTWLIRVPDSDRANYEHPEAGLKLEKLGKPIVVFPNVLVIIV